jgi:hypothetical protein
MALPSSRLLSDVFYFIAMMGFAGGVVLSNVVMSIATMVLGGAWLIRGEYAQRLKKLRDPKLVAVLTSVFVIHVIGLFFSEDVGFGARDIRIKLPLLLLPFLLATMPPLGNMGVKRLFLFFAGIVVYTTLYNTGVMLEWIPTSRELTDIRKVSVFINHVRLSLLVCLAIGGLLYYGLKDERKYLLAYLAACLWLSGYLFITASGTGIVILVLMVIAAVLRYLVVGKNNVLRIAIVAGIVLGGITSYLLINPIISKHYTPREDPSTMASHTAYGEPYVHEPHLKVLENGYYIWCHIARNELNDAWNLRSAMPLSGTDGKGNSLYGTAIRYLTSKGLKKDRDGVNALTDEEIRLIEQGVSTATGGQHGIVGRIEAILFEIDGYRYTGDPSGNSVTQRLEFWKTALYIIGQHPFGVGTGDTQLGFDKAYNETDSKLRKEYRLRAHNQVLTMAVAFGIPGALWFLFSLLVPFRLARSRIDLLYGIFFFVAVCSFLWEDTLETQAGVTFFAFFNTLLLLGRDQRESLG